LHKKLDAHMSAKKKPSLLVTHPKIAKEWHPTKNGELTAADVVAGSSKKVWWQCSKGNDHEWEARLADRSGKGSGCPCCAGKQASVTNSLASLFPKIANEWHPTKNGELTSADVVPIVSAQFDRVVSGGSCLRRRLWRRIWRARLQIGSFARGGGLPRVSQTIVNEAVAPADSGGVGSLRK
jgi:hypothetical protein